MVMNVAVLYMSVCVLASVRSWEPEHTTERLGMIPFPERRCYSSGGEDSRKPRRLRISSLYTLCGIVDIVSVNYHIQGVTFEQKSLLGFMKLLFFCFQ